MLSTTTGRFDVRPSRAGPQAGPERASLLGSRPRVAATSAAALVLSAFLIHILLVPGGGAIKCWVCRSDGDPKCADPFDNSSFPITDCLEEKPRQHLPGLEATMCRKVRQKVNGNWRYLRSCAWLGEPGIGRDERYCIHRSGTYNIHVEYCTCRSKDGCNGAEKLNGVVSSPLMMLILAVSSSSTLLYLVS